MAQESKTEKKNGAAKAFGDIFNYVWTIKNIPFLLFLAAIAVVYIANGHMADNRIRKINDTARKLKDLQYQYKTLKSEMMFKSRETEIAKASAPLGLATDSIAPFRISLIKRKTEEKN